MAEWYCNLFFLDRRKCLIMTHARTLYTGLLFDVKKADLADFGGLLRRRLNAILVIDGFSREERERLLGSAPDSYAGATLRGVIGSMVDHVHMCRHITGREGGVDRVDVDRLNHVLNLTPMSFIGMEYASDALRSLLKANTASGAATGKGRPQAKGQAKPKGGKQKRPAARRCGLCGKTGKLTRTECCANWICDDGRKYVLFSYARNSCRRNHDRYTLCAFHHNERHAGDWKDCPKCRDSFETEMYVWYGTNEYNFEKLPNPPSFAPTKCAKCRAVIHLGTDGFTISGAEYWCQTCADKEMAKRFDKPKPPGSPRAGRPRRK
jgi:hypothetical protein